MPRNEAAAWDCVITSMAGVFQWNSNQRDWFFGSVHILWDLTLGAKPCREQNTIGQSLLCGRWACCRLAKLQKIELNDSIGVIVSMGSDRH